MDRPLTVTKIIEPQTFKLSNETWAWFNQYPVVYISMGAKSFCMVDAIQRGRNLNGLACMFDGRKWTDERPVPCPFHGIIDNVSYQPDGCIDILFYNGVTMGFKLKHL